MPTLSEAESKRRLAGHGIAFPDERVVQSAPEAVAAAAALGHPVVLKLGGDAIAHKTERGLVRLRLSDADATGQSTLSPGTYVGLILILAFILSFLTQKAEPEDRTASDPATGSPPLMA